MPYSVHKNQNRTYGKTRYSFYLQYKNKKYRKTIIVYRTTVEKIYHEWIKSIMDGSIDSQKYKLFEIIDLYLDYTSEKKPQKYLNAHSNELKLFKQFIGNIELNEIKRFQIKDFKDWRRQNSLVSHKKEISVRAVNYSISVLSVFFNWCIDREMFIRSNPASRCKDSEDNYRHVLLNSNQIYELLSKARNCCEWLYSGIVLALFTGLRRKEILELKWGDINFFSGEINLRAEATKSKKQRTIPIPDFLENHLSSIKQVGDWVLMENDSRVMQDKFWHNWERLRDSLTFATLPNGLRLTFHDLRHVYAQSLRDAGINLGDIQAWMGHKSVELTVKRYAQRGGVDGKLKVNKLSDVYNVYNLN